MRQLLIVLILGIVSGLFAQDINALLEKSDALHDANSYDAVFETLKEAEQAEPENFEVIWRLARAHFDLSDNTTDETVKEKNVYDGFSYAERAMKMDDKNAKSHKWYAILIGRVGEIEGTEQKIKNSYKVAEHTLIAIDLDPEDSGSYHVMGRWHFTLADLSWIERKIASWVYAKPPEASFEEASDFFQKAIDLDPDDIRNYVWLGKTKEELDDEKGAADAYKKAISLTADSDSDRILQDEAKELLSDL